jgi:hypothetical protein
MYLAAATIVWGIFSKIILRIFSEIIAAKHKDEEGRFVSKLIDWPCFGA